MNTKSLTTKLIYGKKGLLSFLGSLFLFLEDGDFHNVNFYFTIRNQLIQHFERNYTYNNQLTTTNNLVEKESDSDEEKTPEFKALSKQEDVANQTKLKPEVK